MINIIMKINEIIIQENRLQPDEDFLSQVEEIIDEANKEYQEYLADNGDKLMILMNLRRF